VRGYFRAAFLIVLLGCARTSGAADAPGPEWKALLVELRDADKDRRAAIRDRIAGAGESRLVPALEAYRNGLLGLLDDRLVIYGDRVEVAGMGMAYPAVDALTLEKVTKPDGTRYYAETLAETIKAPRTDRKALTELISKLSLMDPDRTRRTRAIVEAGDRKDPLIRETLNQLLGKFPDKSSQYALNEAIARTDLAVGDRDAQRRAIGTLDRLVSIRSVNELTAARRRFKDAGDGETASLADAALAHIGRYQGLITFIQQTFAGISLASILILLALGLSIIFGLMGVINMAHGELMMIGGYSAYVVSVLFKAFLPAAWFDYYYVLAAPLAFLTSAAVGWLCEVLLIRRLYGRPLETLLATWGLSFVLIQTVRVIFGDTTAITPPSWLTGGWEVAPGLVLPANRLFILGICAFSVLAVYLVIFRTRLGLLLRATTQNRPMAEALGVATRRIDGLTFGFGAGLAGLAGCSLVLFDKLNPQMGQSYIVDSFMVVVVGGVGKIWGSLCAGFGLGFLSKYIEPWLQAVYTKVVVLGLIIVFLQWKPSGLFPEKGRHAD
jgi:urea transport system permease protein